MPAWTPNGIKKYFTEYPELMPEHLWVFQLEIPGDFDPGKPGQRGVPGEVPRTIEDPKGFVPTLPVRTPDYRKDPLVNLLLILWRMNQPRYDIHVSITKPDLLVESGLKYYTYTDFPPLVDVVCPLCGQVGKGTAGEEWLSCECGYQVQEERQ